MIEGIYALHRQSICHRDIKPENILLCSYKNEGYVYKLCDFGISKEVTEVETLMQTVIGTLRYQAPEING